MHLWVSLSNLAVVAATLVLASTPADACPVMAISYRPVSTKNVTMLPDGGVLLAASKRYGQKANEKLTLVDESGTTIDAAEEPLAPGLVRLTPKQHADRELNLVEGTRTLFELQDAAGAPALADTPKVARVTSTHVRSRKPVPRGGVPAESTTITLAAAPPSNVVAIILYAPDSSARAWLPATRGKTYQLSFSGKACASLGMSGTIVGEDVTLAFVDSGGRVSARSKPIRVKRTPPPPKPPQTPTTQPSKQ